VCRNNGATAGSSWDGGQHGISIRIAGTGQELTGTGGYGVQNISVSNNQCSFNAAYGVFLDLKKGLEINAIGTDNPSAGWIKAPMFIGNISRGNGTGDCGAVYGQFGGGPTNNYPANGNVVSNIGSTDAAVPVGTSDWDRTNLSAAVFSAPNTDGIVAVVGWTQSLNNLIATGLP
jgi:hypothetical protein